MDNRIIRHNLGYEKFTKHGRPWIILWSIEKDSWAEATVLEKKLKNLSVSRTIEFMLKYKEGVSGPDELLFIKQLAGY